MPKSSRANLETPPYSLLAEKTVLGAFLIDPERAAELVPQLEPEDFHEKCYAIIFEAIRDCLEKHKTLDFVLVCQMLEDNEKIQNIGGSAHLAQLIADTPTSSHAQKYVNILKEKRHERETIALGRHIQTLGEDPGRSKQLGPLLLEQSTRMSKFLPKEKDAGKDALIKELTTEQTMIPTGFPQMDILLNGGLGPGDLFLIAARPSVGKSALATSLTANFLHRGIVPAFFSLEMSKRQIVTRILCAYYKKTPQEVIADAQALVTGITTDVQLIIGMNDLKLIQAEALRSTADVFLIDYLGLITSDEHAREGRFQVLDEISRSIKNLAIHTGKPIIMLTQLNREIEKAKENREPNLSDLWGGGEKDADVITMLWDPQAKKTQFEKDAEDLGGEKEPDLKWLVRKHRNGPTGEIQLRFDKPRFLLEEENVLPKPLKKSKADALPF